MPGIVYGGMRKAKPAKKMGKKNGNKKAKKPSKRSR
tara:strand:+ start:350 stop:457 length:108 start_codon:yes stop_codon:yes gene_type:complete